MLNCVDNSEYGKSWTAQFRDVYAKQVISSASFRHLIIQHIKALKLFLMCCIWMCSFACVSFYVKQMLHIWQTSVEVLINMSPYVYDTEDTMALHTDTKWGRQALSRLSDMSGSSYYGNLPLFMSISLCGKRQTERHILLTVLSVSVCVCMAALTQCKCQQNQSNWRLDI